VTQAEATRALLAAYEQQRAANRQEEARRAEQVTARDPQVAALLRERAQGLARTLQAACAAPDRAAAIAQAFERRLGEIRDALRGVLAAQGLPPDYLEPVYRCPLCRDTGSVGEPVSRWCGCFRQRLLPLLYSDADMAALAEENFDAFTLDIFPDDPLPGGPLSQRATMARLRDLCLAYAEAFPACEPRNLLFYGPSGLGKTFLMNCIIQRALARGYAAQRTTASKLVEHMRRYHHNGEGAEAYAQLANVPLLAIDDLGAEPMIENVTIVYLLELMGERMAAHRHTLLSTNLPPKKLQEAYSERLTSRLLDTRNTRILQFAGRDVRLWRAASG
jgi:DNA replication protein DnaC